MKSFQKSNAFFQTDNYFNRVLWNFYKKTTKTSGFESTFELLYDFCLIFFYSSTGLNSNKKNYESEFLPACRFTMCLVLRTPSIFSEATKAMHKITNTKILFIVRNTNFPVLIQGWGLLVCVIRPRLHSPLYTTARLL